MAILLIESWNALRWCLDCREAAPLGRRSRAKWRTPTRPAGGSCRPLSPPPLCPPARFAVDVRDDHAANWERAEASVRRRVFGQPTEPALARFRLYLDTWRARPEA